MTKHVVVEHKAEYQTLGMTVAELAKAVADMTTAVGQSTTMYPTIKTTWLGNNIKSIKLEYKDVE